MESFGTISDNRGTANSSHSLPANQSSFIHHKTRKSNTCTVWWCSWRSSPLLYALEVEYMIAACTVPHTVLWLNCVTANHTVIGALKKLLSEFSWLNGLFIFVPRIDLISSTSQSSSTSTLEFPWIPRSLIMVSVGISGFCEWWVRIMMFTFKSDFSQSRGNCTVLVKSNLTFLWQFYHISIAFLSCFYCTLLYSQTTSGWILC